MRFTRSLSKFWHRWRSTPREPAFQAPTHSRLKPLLALEPRCLPSVTPIGGEFRIDNLTGTNVTTAHAVAVNPTTHGSTVVWSSYGHDAPGTWGVYAQQFDSSGHAVGGPIAVNTTTAGDQINAVIAMDNNGDFVVAWQSTAPAGPGNTQGVVFRLYNASGTALTPETQAQGGPAGNNDTSPAVAMDPTGNFVITWTQTGPTSKIQGQFFNTTGHPQGPIIDTTKASPAPLHSGDPASYGNQGTSTVAYEPDGSILVAWTSDQNGGEQVFARHIDSDGNPLTPEVQVSVNGSTQTSPALAVDRYGNGILAWSSNQDGLTDILARRLDSSGTLLGNEIELDTMPTVNHVTPSVTYDGGGDVFVTWAAQNLDNPGSWGVYARQFDASGNPLTDEMLINTTTAGDQIGPAVGSDGLGSALVVWNGNGSGSATGVFGQQLALAVPNLSPLGSEVRVDNYSGTNVTTAHAVAVNPSTGDSVVVWSSYGQDAAGTWGVYAQRLDSAGNPLGSPFAVNTTTAGDQNHAVVAMAGNGDFVVAWRSTAPGGGGNTQGIVFRLYDASGNALTPETQVGGGPGPNGANQQDPALAMDPAGDFVITWTQAGLTSKIQGQFFDAAGHSQGGPIDTAKHSPGLLSLSDPLLGYGNQNSSTVAYEPDGSILIGWLSDQNGGEQVFVRHFGSNGDPIAPETQVSYGGGIQTGPALATDTFGHGIIVWSSNQQGTTTIFGNLLDATGAPINGEFELDGGQMVNYATPSVAYEGNGDIFAAWAAQGLDSPGTWGVFDRQFDSSGNPLTAETLVNTTTAGDQMGPAVASNNAGAAVIAWNGTGPGSTTGIFAQEFARDEAMTVPSGLYVTDENGGSVQIPIVLSAPPSSAVHITVSSSNIQEGLPSPTTLTFNPGNWSTAQYITVTGQDDHIYHGDQYYSILLDAHSHDPAYNGSQLTLSLVNEERDVPSVHVVAASPLVTNEDGGTATFSMVLTTVPLAPVTITFSGVDPHEGTLSTTRLTFDASNWSTAQTVTVTGVDDHIVHGDQTYQIVSTVTSRDPNYSGYSIAPITVVNQERDRVGVTVVAAQPLVTDEHGSTAQFSMRLTGAPLAPVTITFSGVDPNEGTLSTTRLTFDASNWSIAQIVTVTGVDDHIVHGDQTYQIVSTVTSADSNYSGFSIAPLTVVNQERDQVGVTVVAAQPLVTDERGGTAQFSMRLTSAPTAPVTLTFRGVDPAEGSLSTSSLTFNASNWATLQTVTVTGLDDHIVHGNQTYQFQATVTSADANYAGFQVTPLTVVNRERDQAGIVVTGPASIHLTSGEASVPFSVALASEPLAAVNVQVRTSNPQVNQVSAQTLVFNSTDWNVPQAFQVQATSNVVGSANSIIVVSAGASADATYRTVRSSTIAVTVQGTPPALTVAPTIAPTIPPTVAPPTVHIDSSAASHISIGGALSTPTSPSSGAGSPASPGNPANQAATGGAAAAIAAATVSGGGHGQVQSITLPTLPGNFGNGPLVSAVEIAAALKTATGNESYAVIRDGAVTGKGGSELVDARPSSSSTSAPTASVDTDDTRRESADTQRFARQRWLQGVTLTNLVDALDQVESFAGRNGEMAGELGVASAAGFVATTGYVLLNTRAGYWLLSLLMAKPLWQEFDPLEVLYAWENDGQAHAPDDDESLVSLVE